MTNWMESASSTSSSGMEDPAATYMTLQPSILAASMVAVPDPTDFFRTPTKTSPLTVTVPFAPSSAVACLTKSVPRISRTALMDSLPTVMTTPSSLAFPLMLAVPAIVILLNLTVPLTSRTVPSATVNPRLETSRVADLSTVTVPDAMEMDATFFFESVTTFPSLSTMTGFPAIVRTSVPASSSTTFLMIIFSVSTVVDLMLLRSRAPLVDATFPVKIASASVPSSEPSTLLIIIS